MRAGVCGRRMHVRVRKLGRDGAMNAEMRINTMHFFHDDLTLIYEKLFLHQRHALIAQLGERQTEVIRSLI